MNVIITALVIFIALQHIAFLYLEMFLWTKAMGRRIFGSSLEYAQSTRILAANQGLYNGFIAAGLIWGSLHPDAVFSSQIILFFITCVIIAGTYGGITVKKSIFYIQALPAIICLGLISIS